MTKALYMIKRIANMDHADMIRKCHEIHKKTGIPGDRVFWDMIGCGTRYGAGYMDYYVMKFYELNDEQRKTYINRTSNASLADRLNDRNYRHILANKSDFNKFYHDRIGRDWLDLRNSSAVDFWRFTLRHKAIIVKPLNSNSGQGIYRMECLYVSMEDALSRFRKLLEEGSGIVEEVLTQRWELSEIHPASINTIRVYTLRDDAGTVHIICTLLRAGTGNSVVDNANAGGIVVPVDTATGRMNPTAIDKKNNEYKVHPTTGYIFEGKTVPCWEDILRLCLDSAEMLPGLRYIGWDVALTPEGPVLIEGNHIPDHTLLQFHCRYTENKTGMLPVIDRILRNETAVRSVGAEVV